VPGSGKDVTGAVEIVCREQRGHSLDQMAAALMTAFPEARMRDAKTSVALYAVSSDVDGAKIVQETESRSEEQFDVLLREMIFLAQAYLRACSSGSSVGGGCNALETETCQTSSRRSVFREVQRMTTKVFTWGALLWAVAAGALAAQTTSAVFGTPPGVAGAIAGGSAGGTFVAGGNPNGVTGQPFSALEESETVQTLADGTHITSREQKVMHYRDSLGRTRTEHTPMPMPGFLGATAPAPPVFTEIVDPVAGYRYSFDSNSHTAHRVPMAPMARMGKVTASSSRPVPALFARAPQILPEQITVNGIPPSGGGNVQQLRPEMSRESLGTQPIEGLLADGTRMTTTYPVGFMGNDRPLTTVTETWMSREIGMAVLTKTSDPRQGERTGKLTNVSRAEPDPSLFQPPAGYEVVDPAGEVTVR
jgi:hypothetical protein